jgi:hypothetical protein
MDFNDLSKNPEQIRVLIELLQNLLPQHPEEESVPSVAKQKIKTRSGQKNNKKSTTSAGSSNKFESMSEFSMHKEDSNIDKVLSKLPPVARTREEAEPVDVVCRVCGKKETVSPSLIFDSISRYKCNNCATQSG